MQFVDIKMKDGFKAKRIFLIIFISFVLFTFFGFVSAQTAGSSTSPNNSIVNNKTIIDDGGIEIELVKEQVKCVFDDSKEEQKCYTIDVKFSCSGTETCVADVFGNKAEKLLWKSSCGGYGYTITDGEAETIKFDCSAEKPTSCSMPLCPDGDAYDTGKIDGNGCVIYKCSEVSYSCLEGCICDEKGNPIKCAEPVCGNGICEIGEGEVCTLPEQVSCNSNEPCAVSGTCQIICPKDCNIIDDGGIYVVNLNQEFKLKV